MNVDTLNKLLKAKPGRVVEAYLQLREKKRALEAEAKLIGVKLEDLEYVLLHMLDQDLEQEGFRARGHVVYKSEYTSIKVTDREAFFKFVEDNAAYDLLESRVSKDAAKLHMEEMNGEPVPGTTVEKIQRVGVRKA